MLAYSKPVKTARLMTTLRNASVARSGTSAGRGTSAKRTARMRPKPSSRATERTSTTAPRMARHVTKVMVEMPSSVANRREHAERAVADGRDDDEECPGDSGSVQRSTASRGSRRALRRTIEVKGTRISPTVSVETRKPASRSNGAQQLAELVPLRGAEAVEAVGQRRDEGTQRDEQGGWHAAVDAAAPGAPARRRAGRPRS